MGTLPGVDTPRMAKRPEDVARYRRLDQAQIGDTLLKLKQRIGERFPDSGLSNVSGELVTISSEAFECVDYLRRPHWPLRIAVGVVIAAMLAVLVLATLSLSISSRVERLSELVQMLDSAINDIVFFSVGVYFLFTLEARIKRRRALRALHLLRSIVHIVDMHQLTKDPERLMVPRSDTASSPTRQMSPPELGRYLDYCSELLSLTSKIAALFVQHFNDPVVLSTVNEIETLVTGLSGKIWQKITLLERVTRRELPTE
jgi:hypothetical protein